MLRDALRQVWRRAPFRIDAWVVLPEHMHCLWTLPASDAEFPGRWRDQDGIPERGWARICRLPISVIPGRPAGAGPEPMNTCNSRGS